MTIKLAPMMRTYSPKVLDVMSIQGDSIRLRMLLALRNHDEGITSGDILDAIEIAKGEKVQSTAISHLFSDLEGAGLAHKLGHNSYALLPFGSASLQAFAVYHSGLLRPVIDALRASVAEKGLQGPRALEEALPTAVLDEMERADAGSIWPVPGVLQIMKLQSDPVRLAVLLNLSENPEGFVAFRLLLESVQGVNGKNIAGSTLSNHLAQIGRQDLVERGPNGSSKLTPLGAKSIEAFHTYHASLEEKLAEDFDRMIYEKIGSIPRTVSELRRVRA